MKLYEGNMIKYEKMREMYELIWNCMKEIWWSMRKWEIIQIEYEIIWKRYNEIWEDAKKIQIEYENIW